jgi:hypothetical protein
MCVSNNRRFACNKAAGRLALPGALIKIDDDGVVIRRTNRGGANVAPLRSILFQKVLFRPRGQLGLLDKSHESDPISLKVGPDDACLRLKRSYPPGVNRLPTLILEPSLSRQRVAHGLMDLRAPCAETGLHQVSAKGVPVRRKAVRRVDSDQYESADIGKRP